ncbi:universal stress protein [Aquibaculum arenosum]|uniref:Universal stress protein n=1 Tax=Aquibaculum arenosum TaxID=3032591 RepID=A0ABT5YR87_9PROT|nr:universal stress protein [Fodinicurvata sp. CAU 1616]MDF2096729.1 universal stress protein [Fodinicurvata sp. CAU 1616]
MAIKDLLVAYQGDEDSKHALRFALQMAKKYGASVTGAYVFAPEQYESQIRHWIGADFLKQMRQVQLEAVAGIEASFLAAVQETAPEVPHEWVSANGPPGLTLARMSRSFDMLITGQFEGAVRMGGRAVQPEEVIVRSGKPLVMVPKGYSIRPFKEEAAVAWDGSRSATRALTDAMQILETKKRLDVVTVNSSSEEAILGWAGEHDIIAHLKRHSIDARHVPLEIKGSLGKTILSYCQESDPDVLVMGAFGRGKLGSLLFGGVSQYILEHQTVPVLMSH